MAHPDIDYLLVLERNRERMAEAAHARLVKEAEIANRINAGEAAPSRSNRLRETLMLFVARFLSFTGERMLNWSCRLQYRYALLAAAGGEKRPSPCES